MKKSSKNNLLILTSTFPRWKNDNVPGFVYDFAKHIKGKDWSPLVLVPHYPGAQKYEEMESIEIVRFQYWFRKKGQNIVYGGGALANRKKTPVYYLKVTGYVFVMLMRTVITTRRKHVRIINPHWLIPQGFIAVLASYVTGAKIVITIHGGDVFSFNGRLSRAVKAWTLKRADEVVVNSSATLEAAKSIYEKRVYNVVPMGIDTGFFSPSTTKDTKSGPINILFVGRLSEEKGVLYLCQAIKELVADNYKDIELTIAGSGPEKSKIESFINESELEKYIKMAGWVNPVQLPDFYRSADIFVGPSIISNTGWQEAFGLVFAESLATGTPVIATKTGGIKDIVIDGENGFLVPDKDSSAIADKLKHVIDDRKLLAKMQIKARTHIVNNFSWNVIVRKYDNILKNLEEDITKE